MSQSLINILIFFKKLKSPKCPSAILKIKYFFGPPLNSIYIASPLDLSLLHFTVAGASGDYHLALAFLKIDDSDISDIKNDSDANGKQ